MKYNLSDQFTPTERALLLLNKYPFEQLKEQVNGLISQAKKNTEITSLNYWLEVSSEIQRILKQNKK